MKQALYNAEQKYGRPVYLVEIYKEWRKLTYSILVIFMVAVFCVHDLYYNDEILADEALDRFSLNSKL